MDATASLAREKYIRLTTFRRNGHGVATPVWFVVDGERILVWTGASTAKVRRLRADPRVEVAASTFSGEPRGEVFEGSARLLPAAEGERVQRLLRRKYPLAKPALDIYNGLARRIRRRPRTKSVDLEITLDDAAADGPARRCALIVIDVQRGFDSPVWGRRNNPDCERNIATLIEACRSGGWPLVFVRHDSVEPESPLRPGSNGNHFKDVVVGDADLVVSKHVNSAFYGEPDLEVWLRENAIQAVAICGITSNHCCETTARMAGNLGFQTFFVSDATHTFDRTARDGSVITAEDVQRMTEANLDGEFAIVVSTAELLGQLAGTSPT